MEHIFKGKWISEPALAALAPRNVFHRQLDKVELDCTQYRDRHILFRRKFTAKGPYTSAKIFISADDYYKLYLNGRFVGQGPAPCYHFAQNYNEIDVGAYLVDGENTLAVHVYYQGLINRVWQSGDFRSGLLCDLEIDGKTALSSDESFRVATHTGYTEMGTCGYATQILARYDCRAPEVGFEAPCFDDTCWKNARLSTFDDHVMRKQESKSLTFEEILPQSVRQEGERVLVDFGANYVGYLSARATGARGDTVTVYCAQELNADGTPRYKLRANCEYREEWVLSGGEDLLRWFDYKSFRYAEFVLPEGATVSDVRLIARHYPFALQARLRPAYAADPTLREIWQLCVRTQEYGVQEVIQDCMEREKGFYLGDGCYTALTHMLLTGDDSMVRKLIDDAFASCFITDTLVTCLDCSFMQEIAEYPLIMVSLLLWHYRYTGDAAYLRENYRKALSLMEAYRRDYESEGLLRNLDKWCVVEWPKNFQDGYDADIAEGKVCEQAHIAINAYYIYAVRMMNAAAAALGEPPYRETAPLTDGFLRAFYDGRTGLFVDSEGSAHSSLVGNAFAYAFDLCPSAESKGNVLALLDERGVSSLSLFCTFPVMMRLAKDGDNARLEKALSDAGAWRRMLAEGATATFEGWGKDTKWNTSLFHLTMSYAAVFMADIDLPALFE